MPWAAVAVVGAAAVTAKDGPADLPALIEKPNCEGCGAPTVPHAAVCAYCNRPKEATMLNWFRRTANKQTPLGISQQAQMEQMRRRLALQSRLAARASSPAPAPSPKPDYSAPFAAAAFSGAFSSSADSGSSCSSGVFADSSGVSSSSCSSDSSSFSSGGGGDFGGGGASGEY